MLSTVGKCKVWVKALVPIKENPKVLYSSVGIHTVLSMSQGPCTCQGTPQGTRYYIYVYSSVGKYKVWVKVLVHTSKGTPWGAVRVNDSVTLVYTRVSLSLQCIGRQQYLVMLWVWKKFDLDHTNIEECASLDIYCIFKFNVRRYWEVQQSQGKRIQ